MSTKHEEIKKRINDYANANDTDLAVYFGNISRAGYESLAAECSARSLRRNIVLLMVTFGGDPNAAYRIARVLQENYETVSPKVPKPRRADLSLSTWIRSARARAR